MSWFEKELDYASGNYDSEIDTQPSKGSLTGRLWDYMGPTNWNWNSSARSDPDRESREKIQREVAGTVNLLNNSTDGNEKSLKLGFANNHDRRNDIGSDTVVMPADIATSAGSEENAIDVMSGMALIASTMKATVDFHAYEDALRLVETCGTNRAVKGGHYIWTAIEQAIARRAVSDKWPGFDSYFDAHRNYSSRVEGKDIDKMIEVDKAKGVAGGISRGTAMVAAAFNTLNPREAKLMSDGRMHKVMNLIADIALDSEKKDRFAKSTNIADFIYRAFESEEDEEDGDGEGDESGGENKPEEGGKEGDKDNEEESKDNKEEDNPFKNLPDQADMSLFGNEVNHLLSDDEEPLPVDELVLPRISTREGGPANILVYGYPKSLVKARQKKYKDKVSELKGEIRAVVNSLLFMNNHPESHIHGMRHGTLDSGSLHKLAIDTDNPTVFEQVENITGKRIAVSLLIDRSGSMIATSTYDEERVAKTTRQDDANQVAMILIEALSKIDGINLNVHTHCTYPHRPAELKKEIHTGHTGTISDDMTIHDIVVNGDDAREMLVDLSPGGNNLDGYAIKYIAEGMSKDYHDYDDRVLFVISDGQPHASYYGDYGAMRHVGDCCSFSREVYGTDVYGIGVANAFDEDEGKTMYGEDKFIILEDVTPSIKVMTSFLRKVAVKR